MSNDAVAIRTRLEFRCLARFDGESALHEPEDPLLSDDIDELRKSAMAYYRRLCDLQNYLLTKNCTVLLVAADGKEPSRWERVPYHVE